VRAYPNRAAWALVFDEVRIVLAQYDGEEGRLPVDRIVAPPSAGQVELLERLLMVKGLWQETGGRRLGLDGPGASTPRRLVPAAA
jgi:hypothetical protein